MTWWVGFTTDLWEEWPDGNGTAAALTKAERDGWELRFVQGTGVGNDTVYYMHKDD
jgi:hypothetical protein